MIFNWLSATRVGKLFPDGWKHPETLCQKLQTSLWLNFFARLMVFCRLSFRNFQVVCRSLVLQGMLVGTSRDLHALMTA